jgi:hypothetical protein
MPDRTVGCARVSLPDAGAAAQFVNPLIVLQRL